MAMIDPRHCGVRRKGADRKLAPEAELAVVRDFFAGIKLRELCQTHGISKFTVYAILDRHGVDRPKRTPKQENAPGSDLHGG